MPKKAGKKKRLSGKGRKGAAKAKVASQRIATREAQLERESRARAQWLKEQ